MIETTILVIVGGPLVATLFASRPNYWANILRPCDADFALRVLGEDRRRKRGGMRRR